MLLVTVTIIPGLFFPKTKIDEPVRLFSVSKDRHVAEYDLTASNTRVGIKVLVRNYRINARTSEELNKFIDL